MTNQSTSKKRFYLHGDAHDSDPKKFYCALCNLFKEKEHFYADSFHKSNNQQKYASSLERLKAVKNKLKLHKAKSSDVINLFSDFKRKYGKFYCWLKKQVERDDPIGDLANDAINDSSFPAETDSFDTIKDYLIIRGACDEAVQSLKEAYDEFNYKKVNRTDFSLKLRFDVFRNDNYRCRICGASAKDDGVKLEVDHIVPRSKGGSNDRSNLWTLCFKCNRGKSASSL